MKAPLLLLAAIIFAAFIIVSTNMNSVPQTVPGLPLLPRTLFYVIVGAIGGVVLLFLSATVAGVIKRRDRIKEWFAGRSADTTLLLPTVLYISTMILLIFIGVLIISFIRIEDEYTLPPEYLGGELDEEVDEAEQEQEPGEIIEIPRSVALEADEGKWRRIMLISLLAAFSAGSVFLIVLLLKSSRGTAPVESDEEIEAFREDLFKATGRSLETLLEGTNPKLAVIAAYAVMEESFAAHNFKRKPSQTPMEFMAQTLSDIRERSVGKNKKSLPDRTLMALTEIFEIAKFSTHAIAERDRRSAIQQLEAIQAFLTADEVFT